MTGIVAVIAAAQPNVVYGAGLYQTTPSPAVDTSPISVPTQSSEFAVVNLSYEWVGYLRGVTTGSIQLGASCPYVEYRSINGGGDTPIDWGGGGDSTGQIWTGATAISGYDSSNRTAFIQNGTGAVTFPVTTGVYYPIRVQWTTSLPRFEFFVSFALYRYYAISDFNFQINGSNAVSGQIFYNALSNGF